MFAYCLTGAVLESHINLRYDHQPAAHALFYTEFRMIEDSISGIS
jgi:hypothetical protein